MRLEITCCDRLGIAQEILGIFVKRNIDLRGIELQTTGKIFINIPDISHNILEEFIVDIDNIDGVLNTQMTPYMPSELEHIELATLIKTLPEPFISIDSRGLIRSLNNFAAELFSDEHEQQSLIGKNITDYLQGLNFIKWMQTAPSELTSAKIKYLSHDFWADILPIHLPDNNGMPILAGALMLLKSEKRLDQQLHALKQTASYNFEQFTVQSDAMLKVIEEAKKAALLNDAILIMGETGTGKELLARACHAESDRSEQPFVMLSCASIPDDAIESELFGSEGVSNKRGLLELANQGTLFLDEVGEMSLTLQTKLLRVIQDGCFRRIDNEDEISVDVRVISTTKYDLFKMVSDGKFREDLYYRLNVLGVKIPSLRDRVADVTILAEKFINKFSLRNGSHVAALTDECKLFLQQYSWPGNVRQLENVINRTVSFNMSDTIEINDLNLPTSDTEDNYLSTEFNGTLDETLKGVEAQILKKLYPSYPSSRQLAKKLGLSHTAVANKLKEHNIRK